MLPALLGLFILLSLSFAAVQWSFPATDSINGKPVVSGGKAVFTSYDGNVYALSADSGTVSWTYPTSSGIIAEPVLADDGTVAVGTVDGKLLFLDLQTGRPKATADLESAALCLQAGEGKVFACLNSSVAAYSPAGKLLWKVPMPSQPGQIGYSRGAVYFTSNAKLYSLTATNGAPRWTAPAEDSHVRLRCHNAEELRDPEDHNARREHN